MPNRVVRAGLWDSDHFLGLRDNSARVCYLRLYKDADDYGNLEGSATQLRRMWMEFGIDTLDKVAKTLNELVDAMLVGVYEVDGKQYLHVFKFWQRLRQKHRLIPGSPWIDDEQKQDDSEKPPDTRPPRDRRVSADGGLNETKRQETKRNETNDSARASAGANSPQPRGAQIVARCMALGVKDVNPTHAKLGVAVQAGLTDAEIDDAAALARERNKGFGYLLGVALGRREDAERKPAKANAWWSSEEATYAKARELGLTARNGEDWAQFRRRIEAKISETQGT